MLLIMHHLLHLAALKTHHVNISTSLLDLETFSLSKVGVAYHC